MNIRKFPIIFLRMRFWRACRTISQISRRYFNGRSSGSNFGTPIAAASVLGFSLFNQSNDSSTNIYEDIKFARYGEVYRRLKNGETASQGNF